MVKSSWQVSRASCLPFIVKADVGGVQGFEGERMELEREFEQKLRAAKFVCVTCVFVNQSAI